jgi:methyl-accepting chemotaxis protein
MRENQQAGEEVAGASQNIVASLQVQNELVQVAFVELELLIHSVRAMLEHAEMIQVHTQDSLQLSSDGALQIANLSINLHRCD